MMMRHFNFASVVDNDVDTINDDDNNDDDDDDDDDDDCYKYYHTYI